MASPYQPHFLDENNLAHLPEVTSAEQYGLLPSPLNSPNPKELVPPSFPEPVSQKLAFSRRFQSPPTLVPIAVIVVHTLLLASSWTFFAITIKKPIPLSPWWANAVRDNPQWVVAIISNAASGIEIVAATLYTLAIKYSLTRFLAKGVSLSTIASAMRLSQKSLITNSKRPLWTIAAALGLIAVGTQSSGWTTLLIPRKIEIKSLMSGYELDLKSPAFQNFATAQPLFVTSKIASLIISVTQGAGIIAVLSHLGQPGNVNFDLFSYANSTMGIMPVSTQVTGSSIASANATLPVRVDTHKVVATPEGSPARFFLTQQGFTAQVSCQQRTLDNTTQPSLVLHPLNFTLPSGVNVSSAQLEVLCAGATNSDFSVPVLTSDDSSALLGVPCPVNQTGEREGWDLILYGSGIYDFIGTTVCSVFPEINMVNVTYGGNTSFPGFINSSQPWGGQDAPWLGPYSVGLFLEGLQVGQSVSGNLVGDTVRAFYDYLEDKPGAAQEILAQYIRGVMEVGITMLRTAYTAEGSDLYLNGSTEMPADMRSNISGTYWVETIGWSQSKQTAGGVLLSPTFVSLTSILIIIVTLTKKAGDEPEANRYFDPSDLIHVISAASSGGLAKVNFPTYDEKTVKYSDTITVTLAPVGGPGTKSGFISHDE